MGVRERESLMNKRFLTLLAAVSVLAAGLTSAAFADDGEDDDDIQGMEQLHLEVVLIATTNAPAGATGEAEFEGENDHGTNSATLEVETEGLAVGTYTVSVTDNTGTNTYVLGTFDVSSATDTNEDDDSQGDNDDQGEDTGEDSGEAEFALPPGVNPMDIAAVAIADTNGLVVLVGDFTLETGHCDGEFYADVDVTDGDSSTNVIGTAHMTVKIKHGKPHGKFFLKAHGVPAKTKLTVLVNGVATGRAHSNKLGNVRIKNLHQKNLMKVKTVVAEDADHHVVLKAKF